MPVLGALISGMFGSLAAFLSKFFVYDVAVKTAAVSALFGFAATLMVVFNAAVAPLVGAAFSTQYGQVLGLAFPPVAGTCMATVAGVWSACALFSLQRRATAIVAS